jgi:hypothetical protein
MEVIVVLRDVGKVLLAVSGIVFTLVFARLAWLAKSYGLGFDLLGIWKVWGGWIFLWLLITGGGFFLLTVRRF